jgi:hypothetical protein
MSQDYKVGIFGDLIVLRIYPDQTKCVSLSYDDIIDVMTCKELVLPHLNPLIDNEHIANREMLERFNDIMLHFYALNKFMDFKDDLQIQAIDNNCNIDKMDSNVKKLNAIFILIKHLEPRISSLIHPSQIFKRNDITDDKRIDLDEKTLIEAYPILKQEIPKITKYNATIASLMAIKHMWDRVMMTAIINTKLASLLNYLDHILCGKISIDDFNEILNAIDFNIFRLCKINDEIRLFIRKSNCEVITDYVDSQLSKDILQHMLLPEIAKKISIFDML